MSDLPPERWREVEELFAKAWEAPAGTRATLVRELARGDAALTREVLTLVDAAEASPDYLDSMSAGLRLAGLDIGPLPDRSGRRVGPYRLTRALGHGGMGSVYLAERADGAFDQTVAIKLLPVGMMRPAHERRFLAERQILARMENPHIARLLDGGVTEDGTPYFVMEYVDGLPIDEYCERHALPIAERLRLFLPVCEAVDSAHRNLVIHRDLKPTNVLVATDGTVKLLDFGIAKLLSSDDGATDGQPLTPAYASPEQLEGQPLTTAVDVWGLGAILYELVTAQRAFNRNRDGARTPPPPSQLRRGLSRDVDTIVLAALQPEPQRRYPSVVRLADDVRRYLDGLPVQARADSRMYRLTCFVRRHRYGVAAAAVIVALFGALTGLSLHSAARAREHAARIAQEHEASTEVMKFLVDVFATADPAVHRGQTITARELLDRGAARVRTELAGRPQIQATLLGTIGRVYRQLGLLDRATPLLEEALTERRRRFGAPHPAIAEALQELGLARWSAGRADEAEQLLRQALEMWQSLSGAPNEQSIGARTALGRLLSETGRPIDGARELRLAVQHARSVGGDTTPMVAHGLYHLGMVLHHQGKMYEAADSFREAAELYRRLPMEPTPESAESVLMLAALENSRGQDSAAASLYAEALDVHRRLYGVDHPKYAEALHDSANANVSRDARDLARAEEQMRQAVQIYARHAVPDHEGWATALIDLGRMRRRRGDLDAAGAAFQEALALSRRIADPVTTAMALQEVALIDRARGHLASAARRLHEVAAIYRQALGPDSPMLLRVAMAQGEVAHDRGQHDQAQALLRHALTGFEELLGPDHLRVARARLALGICLAGTGRAADARPLLVAAESRLRSIVGADAPETRRAVAALNALQ
jgi:tetratricopeptide (TPR) repeat protein